MRARPHENGRAWVCRPAPTPEDCEVWPEAHHHQDHAPIDEDLQIELEEDHLFDHLYPEADTDC